MLLIDNWLNLGVKPDTPPDLSRRIRLINLSAGIIVLLDIVYLLINLKNMRQGNTLPIALGNAFSIVFGMTALWLNYSLQHNRAKWVFFFLGLFLLPFLAFALGPESFSEGYILAMIALTLFVNQNHTETKITTFLVFGIYLITLYLYNAYTPLLVIPYGKTIFYPINFIIAFWLIFGILRLFKLDTQIYQRNIEEQRDKLRELNEEVRQQHEEISQQRDNLSLQNEIVEAKNNQITESITYAQRIQRAILPDMAEMKQALPEHFILFKPRDIVSGDFYWFHHEADMSIFALADCTGHGVPGAMMSMLGINLLEQIVVENNILMPQLILQQLNQRIGKVLKQENGQNQDGMDMALCAFHHPSKTLHFAGAANSLLLINTTGLQEIKANKEHIGGRQPRHSVEFQLQTLTLQEPTMVYLTTDGYKDQFGGKLNRKFMSANLKSVLLQIYLLPMQDQLQFLENTIEQWMQEGKEQQIDDISLLGVRLR